VEARNAVALDSSSPEIHYHLGASYLAIGDLPRANSAYRDAVERFGTGEAAVRQLETMIGEGIAEEGARRILASYFVESGNEVGSR